MAITPKQILDTAVGLGKTVVSAAGKPLRRNDEPTTSGSPTTVGAPKPGAPRGHKSATAATGRPAKSKAKPSKDKTSTPRKRATGRRSTASRAAASSGKDVADAASRKSE